MLQAVKVFIALGFTISFLIFMGYSMDSYTPKYKNSREVLENIGVCLVFGYGASLVLVGGFLLWNWAVTP